MLTEGADVPDVETVFITRQTTSTILLTQMIGRALRGEKAGGSNEANIVLFFDDWKRLIDWADPLEGGTEDGESAVKGHYPLEYISTHLIEEVAKSIESGGSYQIPPFTRIFPVGWFKTDIAYANSDPSQDSIEGFIEFIMAYEHNRHKFDAFIDFIATEKANLPEDWAKEDLDEAWVQQQIEPWRYQYFTPEEDDMGGRLGGDLAKLVRHITQNGVKPDYHSFEDRDLYDLDKIAYRISNLSLRDAQTYLENEFAKPGLQWKMFYKDLTRFRAAAQNIANSILDRELYGNAPQPEPKNQEPRSRSELTEVEKEQIKQRDGYTCLCCGATTKKSSKVKLQIDHIQSLKMGGETSLDNSHTLCSTCNLFSGVNEFNFRYNVTLLRQAKLLRLSQFTRMAQEEKDSTRTITRIVSWFYQCKAFYKINSHTRKNGRYYSIWEIQLYAGNNATWLDEQKGILLNFIQHDLGCPQVQDIQVTAPK